MIYSILAAVILLGACQKEELSIKDKIQESEEKRTNLLFDFKAEQLTLNAEEVTDDPAFGRRGGQTSLVFQDKMWVIAGVQGGSDNGIWTSSNNDVWYSDDGMNWTAAIENAAFGERSSHASTVFQDRMWVAGGYASGGTTNDVWSSSDGVVWEQATAGAKFPTRAGHTLTAFNSALWVIGGRSGALVTGYDELADVWMSYNGRNWYKITDDAPLGSRFSHVALVHDNKLWVIGGFGEVSGYSKSDVWCTSDGFNWIEVAPDGFNYENEPTDGKFQARGDHGVVSNGRWMWLTAGAENDGLYPMFNDIWRSKNGVDWYEVGSTLSYPTRHGHSSLIFDNNLWIITGLDSTIDPGIMSDIWSFDLPRSSPGDFKQH